MSVAESQRGVAAGKTSVAVAAGLLACLFSLPAGAQTFEDEASVLVVEVPVQVLAAGHPVRGLSERNFEILDDGEPQQILGFEVLDLSTADPADGSELTDPGARPSHGTARHFLFVIDFANPGSWDPVYGAGPITAAVHGMEDTSERLTSVLGERLHPRDRLAIAYLSPLRGLKLLLGWTADRDDAARAFEILQAASKIEPEQVRELWLEWGPGGPECAGGGEAASCATLEDLLAEARTASVRADPTLPYRDLLEDLIDGLIAAGRSLGETPGPRHVVFLSTGLPIESLDDLQRLFREFRRTHWSIQTVNTGGLGFGSDSLFLLAHETGGQLFTNSNDVDVLLEDMVDETAVTYLLSFQAESGRRVGSFHKLRVKLIDGPKGARVVHRRGYYFPGPKDD